MPGKWGGAKGAPPLDPPIDFNNWRDKERKLEN